MEARFFRRFAALAAQASALLGFVACSDSPSGPSERVATVRSALSGGSDPVVKYFFNEISGAQASDSSGNGHTATLENGASFIAGARGNAVRISGGTQRVTLPTGVVDNCQDVTIAARVRLATNTANWARIFDFGSSTTANMFLTPRAGAANVLRFAITTGGASGEQQISYTYTFPTATWKHVAVVLQGNIGTLYLDGVQVAQNTNMTLDPAALGSTVNNFIGDSQYAADPTLDGTVDDVLVSCRPYSASEISWLATGTDPQAQYAFDETSGTTAADTSGNARNATLANGASFVSGLHGNAVQIAGGSQRVNLPAGIVQACSDLTIAAHVRLATNASNWTRIFDVGNNTTQYMFLTPRAGASNILRFAITTAGNGAEQRLSYTYTFPTNTWKHVAVVISGNVGSMFLDGAQVSTGSITLNPSQLGATVNNWLGDSQFSADPTLNGTIDNLLISCRPFSPAEIAGLAGACTSAANCDDGNQCTSDTCSQGYCSHSNLADGTPCPNGTVCDGDEVCVNRFCSAGTPPQVDDGNGCTTDACDPVQGVTHTPIAGCGGGAGGSGGTGGSSGGGTAGGGGSSGSGGATCPSGTTAVEMFIETPPNTPSASIALGSYGFTPLEIHDRVRVLAPGGTTFASVSSLSGNPDIPTRLGVESHVHHLFGEPNVELRDRSHVHGNVISPGSVTLFPDAVVDGQTVEQALTPRRRESWIVCHPNAHQGNIDVQPGQVFPTDGSRLAPGAWGTFAVKTGARIRLRGAATYFFESIAIEPGGIVDLDTAAGGIQLYFRNGGFFRGVQERTDARANVLFGFENGSFAINGSFQGTVVAPRGVVDLPTVSGGVHRGSFFGDLVIAHQDMPITHEPVDTTGMCPPGVCNGLCPCGGGSGGGVCSSDGDCSAGLVCGTNNGACFGGARAERRCWPAQCLDGIDKHIGECGEPTSPCGVNCGCGKPCDTEDPASTCPPGEECVRDLGRVFGTDSRDSCGPTGPDGPICPSNDPALCGEEFKICGRHCLCKPDCSQATPSNPLDGCGGLCPDVCPVGAVGCCQQDFQCQDGATCLSDPTGTRTCRPTLTCVNRPLRPPLCGTPGAPCGDQCPVCTPQCDGRECGPDPNCRASCGTCGASEYCDEAAGQCKTPTTDPPITVPDGQGGARDVPDLPPTPASGVGAIPGQFSVSEQGTAQYTLPIDVPPGRAGMTPALSLVYSASRDQGSVGAGWRVDGLSKITRCPRNHALDGYAAAVKNDNTDAFCIDGKRLVVVGPGNGHDGVQYRTLIDSFAKIVSHQEDGSGKQPNFPAVGGVLDRSLQGPDSFEVRTKDGRIMTFGGTLDSLVIGQVGRGSGRLFGVRQAWLLKRIEDRAGNTILYSYDNDHLAGSPIPDGRRAHLLHPHTISYTGHGNSVGNRRVVFTYEQRPDPALRFLHGGMAWALEDRLTRITTIIDKIPVKNYRLVYAEKSFSQLEQVFECEGDTDARCKLPTRFEYKGSTGFEFVPPPSGSTGPGLLSGVELDVNGDGFPDYLRTDVTVDGVSADVLAAGKIAADAAVLVGTSFLAPEIGFFIVSVWALSGASEFFGTLATHAPEFKIEHVVQINPQVRGAAFTGGQTTGLPCDFGNALLDWNRDGRDDVMSTCSNGIDFITRAARSGGDGTFSGAGPALLSTPIRGSSQLLAPPIFYDVDGDSLQDVVYCKDECTIELRRRTSISVDGFSDPIELPPDSACTPVSLSESFCFQRLGGHAIFDIDGDGTPELLMAKAGGQGWHVLRFSAPPSGSPTLAWEDVDFPNVGHSGIGDGLQIADFNNDGLPDVLRVDPSVCFPIPGGGTNCSAGENATIWLNTGGGQFLVKRRIPHPVVPDSNLVRYAIADYDDDGRIDWIEYWLNAQTPNACGANRNVVNLVNSDLTALTQIQNPPEFLRNLRVEPNPCPPETFGMNFSTDFDNDGSMDIHAGGDIFYGRGAANLLLSRVEDGVGNVTTVTYDAPGTYETNCGTGVTWPEMCLKRMTGLVSEHREGFLPAGGTTPVVQRTHQYKYLNARMSTTGHGWLGFDRRTVDEIVGAPGVVPTPDPDTTPPDNELTGSVTTITMEPVARYTPQGVATQSTTPPYIYPLAGLAKTIEVDRSKTQTPLETAAYRRRTRIENTWNVRTSASSLPFPVVEARVTSVFEADLGGTPGEDGALLTRCTETMVPDPFGNITEHEEICPDEESRTITEFDADQDAWLISNPEFISVRHERNGQSQTQSFDPAYDSRGLLQRIIRFPAGSASEQHTTTYVRNVFGNVEQVTETVPEESPRTTSIVYEPDNVYPFAITNPKGQTSQMRFDERWGAPSTIADPNGMTVQHSYDGLGLLAETHDPEGVTLYTYARSTREVMTTVGLVSPRISITAERQGVDGTRTGGVIQELDYRGLPVLTTTEGFAGAEVTSERAYDFRGRLSGATMPHTNGSAVPRALYSYDGLDRLKRVTQSDGTAEGAVKELRHASVITLAVPFRHWLSGYGCEEGDNGLEPSCPVEIELGIDEEGKQDITVMNYRGLINRNVDGENAASMTRFTSYRYGPFNRMQEIAQNELVSGQLPRTNSRTLFSHDAYGRMTSQTDPDSGTTTFSYNGFDELETSLDPKSQLRVFTHDELGRTTRIVDPAGTTEWIYDQGVNALGRISETISPATAEAPFGQRLIYTYEPPTATHNRGHLQRLDYVLDSTAYPVEFTYDDLGRTDTIGYPDLGGGPPVVAKYSYDTSGFLTDLEEIGSGTTRPVWHADSAFEGQLIELEIFGNGASTTYTYNQQRRFLETINTHFQTETLQDIRYTHYKNGQVQERIRNGTEMRAHSYDALNRLSFTVDTSPSLPLPLTGSYAYDHLGNMTQRGASTLTYATLQPHLVSAVGNNLYQHDLNGNVGQRSGPDVPSGIQTLAYTPFDLPNRITSGLGQGEKTTRFEYSADEERLVRRDTGPGIDKTRHFVTDLYQRLVDFGTTTEERFRLYAGSREVAQIVRQNGVDKTLFFHADNLGTPELVTTSDGEEFRQELDPFGSEVDVPSTEVTRSGFTGHEHDRDLGLVDMKGRIYDPLAGRFTSADPIMQAPFWSQGLNRYAYAFNDPVNNTDPSGLCVGYCTFGVSTITGGGTLNPAGGVAGSAASGSAAGIGLGLAGGAVGIVINALAGGYDTRVGARTRTETSVPAASVAPTTRPSPTGLSAANNNTPIDAPVQEARPPGTSLFDPGAGALAEAPLEYKMPWDPSDCPPETCRRIFFIPEPGAVRPPIPTAAPGGSFWSRLWNSIRGIKTPGEAVANALRGLPAGRSAGVKIVGSADELNALFGRLSAGGKTVQGSTYPGKLVELSDKTTVGLRAASKSGGPTIDITLSGGQLWKVHVGLPPGAI